jgi:hypothetical protein
MTSLMAAAQLAGELSHSRRKKIRLELAASGLIIEGRLFDESGERPLYEASLAVSWRQIIEGVALNSMIREIDRQLTEAWRAAA